LSNGVKLSVTSAPPIEREACLKQIDRLIHSHVLHGSESLCKMLQYLAEHSLEHPGSSVKEYQLATEVFGRPSDFDPHLDATIRVQVGRLRAKLLEYYSSVGTDDPIGVELPKGTYALTFHLRAPQNPAAPKTEELSAAGREKPTAEKTVRNLVITILVLSLLLARLGDSRRFSTIFSSDFMGAIPEWTGGTLGDFQQC